MRFGLIGQLDSVNASPHCFVSQKQANLLIETAQCFYTSNEGILRKTSKYGRLADDKKIVAARPGMVRGLSAQVGPDLAEAARRESDKFWAIPMLEQIKEHHLPTKSKRVWRNHSGEHSSELLTGYELKFNEAA